MAGERILLVDDEVDFVEALSARLETREMVVEIANSGQQAIERVRSRRFDIIILDLAMPGMDGLETLRVMRETHPDQEVVLLTGRGTVPKGIEAMKLGAMDFLEKPVEIDVLLGLIREARSRGDARLEQQAEQVIGDILKTRGW